MRAASRPDRRAFTLVELLIALGIIGVLAAVLLAGASKARMHSQRVACSSHLRQVGQALISYAADYDGRLPAAAVADWRYDEDWVHWQADRDVKRGSLMRYLGRDVNVLKCPAGVDERPSFTGGDGRTYPPYPFSYSLNARFVGLPHGSRYGVGFDLRPCKLTECVESSMKVLAIEEDTSAINDGVWNAGGSEYVIFRISSVSVIHDRDREYGGGPVVDGEYPNRGRGNVVFADGHCDFIERWKLNFPSYHDPRHRGPPH
jgi:prepilin-type N-terminal cleavage/methylation domain-containing protein/prepilin-type processing-associated H-X9-DG protein